MLTNFKKKNNWDSFYIGLKDNNKIVAAALLLKKELPIIKKNMFYSPRGFLIDYNDYELLKEFTEKIKKLRFCIDKMTTFSVQLLKVVII